MFRLHNVNNQYMQHSILWSSTVFHQYGSYIYILQFLYYRAFCGIQEFSNQPKKTLVCCCTYQLWVVDVNSCICIWNISVSIFELLVMCAARTCWSWVPFLSLCITSIRLKCGLKINVDIAVSTYTCLDKRIMDYTWLLYGKDIACLYCKGVLLPRLAGAHKLYCVRYCTYQKDCWWQASVWGVGMII